MKGVFNMEYFMMNGNFNYTFIFLIIPLLIGILAQINVTSKYKKYSKISNSRNMTASQAVYRILQQHGVSDVKIEPIRGNLTDNYNPKEKAIRLSEGVYNSTSIAAIGIAAHEAGHAIQYNQGYFPIKIRNTILPIANIGSFIAIPLAILGYAIEFLYLIDIGIILFSAVCLFQLITLPVEINASRRAIRILTESDILYGEELNGAKKVLLAAALTYIAALATSVLTLLRLLFLRNRR